MAYEKKTKPKVTQRGTTRKRDDEERVQKLSPEDRTAQNYLDYYSAELDKRNNVTRSALTQNPASSLAQAKEQRTAAAQPAQKPHYITQRTANGQVIKSPADKQVRKSAIDPGMAGYLMQVIRANRQARDYSEYMDSYKLYTSSGINAKGAKQGGDDAAYFENLAKQAGAGIDLTSIENQWAKQNNEVIQNRRDAIIQELQKNPGLDDYRSQIGMGVDAFADWLGDNYAKLPDAYKSDSLSRLIGSGYQYETDTGGMEDRQRMYADMAEYSRMSDADKADFASYMEYWNMPDSIRRNLSPEEREAYADAESSLAGVLGGSERLEEIAQGYQRYMDEQNSKERQAEHQKEVKDGFWSARSLAAQGKAVGASLAGGITGAVQAGQELMRTATGDNTWNTANPYAEGYRLNQYANDIKAFTGEQIDNKFLKGVYNATMSTMENGARVLATSWMGPGASLAVMAVGSYGQSYQDAALRGASPMQATLFAGASAAIEVLTEKFSIENLLDHAAAGNAREYFANILKQSFIEASEEEASYWAGLVADSLIMLDKSELNLRAAELKAQGLDDNTIASMLFKDVFADAAKTAWESFLSGGMMESIGGTVNYWRNSASGRTIMQDTARADRLRQAGLAAGGDAYQRAQGITMGDKPAAWGALQGEVRQALAENIYDASQEDRARYYREFINNADGEAVDAATYMAMEAAQDGDELAQVHSQAMEKAGDDAGRKVSYTAKYIEEAGRTGAGETQTAYSYAQIVLDEDAISDNVVDNIRKSEKNLQAFRELTGEDIEGGTEEELNQSIRDAWASYQEAHYDEKINENAVKLGEKGREGLASLKIGRTPGRVVSDEYRSYYVGGFTNTDMENVQARTNVLTAEQRQIAFDAGKADAAKSLAFQKAGVKQQYRRADAGLDRKTVPASVSKETADLMDTMGKGLGRRVSFRELPGRQNAYIDNYGNIVINSKAARPAEVLAAHEITHRMQDLSPTSYTKYRDTVMQILASDSGKTTNAIIDETIAAYKKAGVSLNSEQAMDEIAANFAMDMMSNHKLFGQVVQKDINLGQRIVNGLRAVLDKLKAAFGKGNAQQLHYYGVTAENMEKAVKAFERMLADAKGQNRKLKKLTEAEAWKANAYGKRLSAAGYEEFSGSIEQAVDITDGAYITSTDGKRFSIKSMTHDIEDGQMFRDLERVCGWSSAQTAELRRNLTDLIDYMVEDRAILDMNEAYGREGRKFSPYKPNSDPLYKISLDFSTLCSKRLLTQFVIENLQLQKDRAMTSEEQMAIRSMLNDYRKQEKGLQVACAMCYVEAARLKSPNQMNKWFADPAAVVKDYFSKQNKEFNAKVKKAQEDFKEAHGYERNTPKTAMTNKDKTALNKIGPAMRKGYTPSAEEQDIMNRAAGLDRKHFLSAANLANLSQAEPQIYAAYTTFIRNATRSKALETDEPYYYGDSSRDNGNGIVVTDSFIEGVNRENGMRFSSWSDWRIQHMLDYITAVIDMSVRGAAMHGYTKFPAEVRALGKTGMMFNLSGVANGASGLTADGDLDFSPTESIDFEAAKALREEFPETAGLQCIGISNDHINALLRSPMIDYVIPYHTSGLNADLRRMAGIYSWSDYTKVQNASVDKSLSKDMNGADLEHWHEEPVWSEFFVGYNTGMSGIEAMKASAERYRDMCRRRGMTPKFNDFAGEDGYWKLLIDRKMINQKTGELIEQKPVQPIFDFATIKSIVDEHVANYDSGMEARALQHIQDNWDQVQPKIKELKAKKKASKAKNVDLETIANEMIAAIPSSEAEGRTYSIEDSESSDRQIDDAVPGISVTIEDVMAIRNIGKKSVNEFTSEDIGKAARWAKKFYEEIGTKSPFFRAWFGDWREKDSSKYVDVVSSGNQSAENGRAVNNDTGITMSWNVRGLLGETKNHAVKDKIAVQAVNDIARIVENAILLDTVVSMPSGKNKMPNTAFMHAFYSIYQYNGKEYLIKLYAEQALTNKGDAVFTRAYQLKDIEKIAPIPISVSDGSPSLSDDIGATGISVAELYAFVKKYDKGFKPNTAPAALMNSNGTPKVFYRGDVERRDVIRPDYRGAIWATDNVDYAHQRGSEAQPLYVSMKNPYYATVQLGTLSDAYDIDETIRKAQSEGKDGAIISFVFTPSERKMAPENWYAQHAPETPVNEVIRNSRARDGETIGEYMERAKKGPIETHTAVWESGQYKNADDNIGTFDRNNPNTRFSVEDSVQQAEELAVTTPVLKAMEELEKVAKSRDELWQRYQSIAAENASLKAGQAMQGTDIKALKRDIMQANERVRELNKALGKTTAEAIANARENRAAGKAMIELKKEVQTAQANAAKVGATAEAWKQRYREADAGRLAERMAAGREAAAAKRAADAKRKADVSAARQAGKDALNAQKARDADLIKAERLAGQAAVAAEKQAGQKALTAERQNSRDALKEAQQEKKDALQQASVTAKAEKAVALAEAEQKRLASEKELKQKAADRLKQQRENQKESADKAKYRGKVEKAVDTLRKAIATPTKELHVPSSLQGPISDLLNSLDFTSETYQKTGELTLKDSKYASAMHDIATALSGQEKALSDNEISIKLDLPPDFINEINKYASSITAATKGLDVTTNQVYAMSADELRDLHHILKTITHAIRTIDALHMAGAKARVSDVARQTVIDMRGRKATKSEKGNVAVWAYYTPTYAFERMGKGATQILDGLKQGQAKLARTVKAVLDFAEKTYTSKEVKDWERERISIRLDSGETITMTPAQIMSFAMLSNREQAVGHLMGGGMRLSTITRDGRNAEVVQKAHYTLTANDIGTIIGKLDSRQMEVAKALQHYMQDTGGRLGNEITVARWDYAAFTEDGYFPIKTDAEIRDAKNPDQERANLWGLLNKDFTKALTPNANNALVVGSIFDTFAEHMSQMAEYNAFALPLVDAMKWFNYRETDVGENGRQIHTWSVQKTLSDTLGTSATTYFVNLMTDINSGQKAGRHDDIAGKFTSMFKGASVGWNVRVALQQPTAILRASAMIEGKYLAQGSARFGTTGTVAKLLGNEDIVEEMHKYSGIALWKSLGYYDLNVARSITDQIKGDKSVLEKFNDLGMWLPGKMDDITWARIWAACRAKVKADQGLSGEELMQATAKLFDDVCYHTQVADSVLTRNSLMRSKSGIWKELTSFMAEPTMSMNIIMNAFADYQQLTRHKGKAAAWGKTKTALMIGLQGYALSALANAMVTSFVDAFRDDDDYEKWYQKFLQALLGEKGFWDGNIFGELNPIEKIPIAKDFFSTVKGYDNTNSYMQLLKSIYSLWQSASKLFEGKGSITPYGVIYQALQVLGYASGSAPSNMTRDIVSFIWNPIFGKLYPNLKLHRYSTKTETAIKNSYNNGFISEEEAIQYLIDDAGFEQEKAENKVGGWMFARDHADSGLDSSRTDEYYTYIEPAGIDVGVYEAAVAAVAGMSADKDANGNSISGSKKKKVVDYIMSLNLTATQKKALWNALKGTWKDDGTPWA